MSSRTAVGVGCGLELRAFATEVASSTGLEIIFRFCVTTHADEAGWALYLFSASFWAEMAFLASRQSFRSLIVIFSRLMWSAACCVCEVAERSSISHITGLRSCCGWWTILSALARCERCRNGILAPCGLGSRRRSKFFAVCSIFGAEVACWTICCRGCCTNFPSRAHLAVSNRLLVRSCLCLHKAKWAGQELSILAVISSCCGGTFESALAHIPKTTGLMLIH